MHRTPILELRGKGPRLVRPESCPRGDLNTVRKVEPQVTEEVRLC